MFLVENKFIKLEIEPNGRLKLTDKRNGKIYNDLNGIKDDGEGGDGLAFVSANGLHKGGCDNDEASTINVTLYRCFDRVFMQRNAKKPQLQQRLSFNYAIAPLCKETTYADISYIKHCVSESDLQYSGRFKKGSLEYHNKSYLNISNPIIALSIFKCAEDGNGVIARLYNTTDKQTVCKLTPGFEFKNADICNLNEESIAPKKVENGSFEMNFKPWEIITVRLQ